MKIKFWHVLLCIMPMSAYSACSVDDPYDGCECGKENINGANDPYVWCDDCGDYAFCPPSDYCYSDIWSICVGDQVSDKRRCRPSSVCVEQNNCDLYDICDRETGNVTKNQCLAPYSTNINGKCYKALDCDKCFIDKNGDTTCPDNDYEVYADGGTKKCRKKSATPTCPDGQIYSTILHVCVKPNKRYSKQDMLYGYGNTKPINFHDACWTKNNHTQYVECVKNR